MRRRLSVAALSLAVLVLLASAPSALAGQVVADTPLGAFGPEGAGPCAGLALATGAGDVNGASGRATMSLLASGSGRRTSGSPTITNLTTSEGTFEVGEAISGTGIPVGTTIEAIVGEELTMSANATSGSGTNTTLHSGSKVLTGVETLSGGFEVGQEITDRYSQSIPAGATIEAIDGGAETLTISIGVTSAQRQLVFAGSKEVTSVSTECGSFEVGQSIYGGGGFFERYGEGGFFEPQTTITAIGSGTLTLSRLPIDSGTGVALSGSSTFTFSSSGNPGNLAFSESNSTLLALDRGEKKIRAFSSPAAVPVGGAFPVSRSGNYGNKTGLGVDNTSGPTAGNFFVKNNSNSVYGYEADGTPLGGNFPLNQSGSSCDVTVDREGNIWLANGSAGVLDRWDPNGNPLSAVHPAHSPCNVAFDAENNLYFTAGSFSPDFTYGVYKVTAASGYTDETWLIPSEQSIEALVADPVEPKLYVVFNNRVSVFRTDGLPLDDDFATSATVPGGHTGLAVDRAHKRVYVTAGGNYGDGRIFVFPIVPTPNVATAGVSGRTTTQATLHGIVNPQGVPVTECHFEYTTDADFQENGFAAAASLPCSPAPGSGASDVGVSATATGLKAGTRYRFKLVASNANGTDSTDPTDPASFFSLGPVVLSQSSSDQNETTATLHAVIDPNGEGTSYRFEYVTAGQFEQSGFAGAAVVPAGVAGIGNGTSGVAVSQSIGGLSPNTTYHFRAVAVNPAATGVGADTLFGTYARDEVASNCPNAALRAGPSALLPDCRAYEQVSPVDKNGYHVFEGPVWAAAAGGAAAYITDGAFGSHGAGATPSAYSASRGADWRSSAMQPTFGSEPLNAGPTVLGTSPDLSKQLVVTNVALAPGAVPQQANVYVHDVNDDSYEFVTTSPQLAVYFFNQLNFVGASEDGSRFFFETNGAFTTNHSYGVPLLDSTPPATGSENLYEFSGGQLKLLNILPDSACGSPPCVSSHGYAPLPSSQSRPVSADGDRVYWRSFGGDLYLREGGQATEVAAESTFQGASADGSVAFYTDSAGVLHRYDAATGTSTEINPGQPVKGVLGVAASGGYVYFTATGALAPGASAGSCAGAAADSCNLYVWHDGETRYIGALVGPYEGGPLGFKRDASPTLSDSGRYFAFLDKGRIAGPHPVAAQPFRQAYLYDYQSDSLSCASCPPAAVDQVGDVSFGGTVYPNLTFPVVLRDYVFANGYKNAVAHNVSDAGQVFFDSPARLVPRDTNGVGGCPPVSSNPAFAVLGYACEDAYEYQAGQVHLLSPGTGGPSFFGDASASGEDAFIVTAKAGLVGQDTDELMDVYDARVNGGIASQSPQPAAACEGEGCRAAGTSAPASQGAGSASFSGPGNQQGGADCSALARRLRKLSHGARALRRRARVLRRRAMHMGRSPRALRLRRRSHHLALVAKRRAHRAQRLARVTKRCRRANRGAAR